MHFSINGLRQLVIFVENEKKRNWTPILHHTQRLIPRRKKTLPNKFMHLFFSLMTSQSRKLLVRGNIQIASLHLFQRWCVPKTKRVVLVTYSFNPFYDLFGLYSLRLRLGHQAGQEGENTLLAVPGQPYPVLFPLFQP